jgi:hypothetical protein
MNKALLQKKLKKTKFIYNHAIKTYIKNQIKQININYLYSSAIRDSLLTRNFDYDTFNKLQTLG